MTKYKKMLSIGLASCLAVSAMMMSAGAANEPANQTAEWGAPDSMIDAYGVDWSQIDTSMCDLDVDYHRYPQSAKDVSLIPYSTTRNYFTGWIYGIPKNASNAPSTFSIPNKDNLTFRSGEEGRIYVQATDGNSNLPSVNVSVYDVTDSLIHDWVRLTVGGDAKSFTVDPSHSYRFYLSNNHWANASVRLAVEVE